MYRCKEHPNISLEPIISVKQKIKFTLLPTYYFKEQTKYSSIRINSVQQTNKCVVNSHHITAKNIKISNNPHYFCASYHQTFIIHLHFITEKTKQFNFPYRVIVRTTNTSLVPITSMQQIFKCLIIHTISMQKQPKFSLQSNKALQRTLNFSSFPIIIEYGITQIVVFTIISMQGTSKVSIIPIISMQK